MVEPVGLTPWAGVGVMMQEERREEAEKLLSGLAAEVQEITGGIPILLIREGDPRDELLALLEEDPRISVLVLATVMAVHVIIIGATMLMLALAVRRLPEAVEAPQLAT